MNGKKQQKVLMLASVASMIDQFNMPNVRLMQNMGYEVHVLCNFREGNTCDRQRIRKLQRILHDMRVTWHQWDCPRSIFSIKKCCIAYWQLWKLTGQHQFAWLHCHSPVGGALARIVSHQRKMKVIYTAHGFHFYRGAPLKNWLLYYPAEAWLAHWTDALITINKEDSCFAKRHLKAGKIYHIPGVGINVKKFAPYAADRIVKSDGHQQETADSLAVRGNGNSQHAADERKEFCRKYEIPENARILLSVGELNKGKNHQMVIGALSAIPWQNVYYLICGQGSEREELQRYAERMGVSRRIRMLGYQENIQQIYRNADIFVFPSIREGLPAALMEAMAAGLPCAVSDIRGNRELIDDAEETCKNSKMQQCIKQGGIRFSPKNPQQLVNALVRLLEDEQLRQKCGRYNQNKIRAYDQAVVSRKMQKIYSRFG